MLISCPGPHLTFEEQISTPNTATAGDPQTLDIWIERSVHCLDVRENAAIYVARIQKGKQDDLKCYLSLTDDVDLKSLKYI